MVDLVKLALKVAVFAAAIVLGNIRTQAADLVIAMPNWSSGQATANILKVSLKKEFGIDADVVEMGTLIAFAGLDSGQVDIHPEVWLPNLDNLVKKYVTDTGTVAISAIGVPAWQGICANRTAADKYGFKDISDLSDPKKTEALDTDGDGKGEMWIGAETWSSTTIERIRANSYGYAKNLSLLEMAPVLLAAADLYPGRTVLEHGSVMSLWGESSDLASLGSAGRSHVATNSETQALRAAVALGDAEVAQMLLWPFRVELLTEEHAAALASAARDYGQRWTASLLRGWFGEGQPEWSVSESGRNQWIAVRLPGLTRALDVAEGGAGSEAGSGAEGEAGSEAEGGAAAAARLLLDLSWAWLGTRIHGSCIVSSPSRRSQLTAALGEPLSAVLASAASLGAASVLDAVRAHITQQPDPVTVLELATLRAAASSWAEPTSGTADGAALGALAADCAARLRARLALPQRADGDWSIGLPAGCTCELCSSLRKFLAGPDRVFEWPLAEQRRRHVHERIDRAELPVTHVTRRQGRPYTLVLTKTDALFTDERDARATATADLKWLAARWPAAGHEPPSESKA